MRRIWSIALVAILLAVTSGDRIACPDGCADADESSTHASSADAPACTVCQGWTAPAPPIQPATLTTAPTISPSMAANERAPHLPTVDPPPKRL